MEPGAASFRTGMCLQRSVQYDSILEYHVKEKLDMKTRILVGDENFKKVNIETCKLKLNKISYLKAFK